MKPTVLRAWLYCQHDGHPQEAFSTRGLGKEPRHSSTDQWLERLSGSLVDLHSQH